ncbi:unnamed protein product [Arctia plantaginis]|uniref:Uncharacterized protein n=1 Tax=Arctia plantaginis TaxID=874455 RepID=A0A8S1A9Y9_ARCPL|nr:unnamed protein product [Arctia plantaginis]
MKFFAILFFLVQAVLVQNAFSQVIRTAAPLAVSSPIIAQPSVANTLADTLSLLTVSSLLSETLPFNPNVITVPMAAPAMGCGCGCGYGNYGYYY